MLHGLLSSWGPLNSVRPTNITLVCLFIRLSNTYTGTWHIVAVQLIFVDEWMKNYQSCLRKRTDQGHNGWGQLSEWGVASQVLKDGLLRWEREAGMVWRWDGRGEDDRVSRKMLTCRVQWGAQCSRLSPLLPQGSWEYGRDFLRHSSRATPSQKEA